MSHLTSIKKISFHVIIARIVIKCHVYSKNNCDVVVIKNKVIDKGYSPRFLPYEDYTRCKDIIISDFLKILTGSVSKLRTLWVYRKSRNSSIKPKEDGSGLHTQFTGHLIEPLHLYKHLIGGVKCK